MRRSTWIGLALLVAVGASSGCARVRQESPRVLPLALEAPRAFTLHGREGTTCDVSRARLLVEETRGDTIIFSSATALRRPEGAARCRIAGAGHVVVQDVPELRAVSLEREPALTPFAVLYTILSVRYALWLPFLIQE